MSKHGFPGSVSLSVAPITWPLVLALALSSLPTLRSRWRQHMPVLLLALGYLATLLIFFVRARYRIPMAPFLMLMASAQILVWVDLLVPDARARATS